MKSAHKRNAYANLRTETSIYKEDFYVLAEQSLMSQCGKDKDNIKDWI